MYQVHVLYETNGMVQKYVFDIFGNEEKNVEENAKRFVAEIVAGNDEKKKEEVEMLLRIVEIKKIS